jgi:uncharacterized protein (TIGR03437 family)
MTILMNSLSCAVTCGMIAALSAAGAPVALSIVNAANYVSQIAPGSLAAAFGTNLPTDSGTSVSVCDSNGLVCSQATVIAAVGTQINFLVPQGPLPNPAMVRILHGGVAVASGSVPVTTLSPGIFTANNSGGGIFNGQAYDQDHYDAVYVPGSPAVPLPVSAVSGGSPNILILYGTGWAQAGALTDVQANVGGVTVTPDYAGQSSLAGLDQLNVKIPAWLATASNKLVNVTVSFGNFSTNTVQFCLAGLSAGSNCPVPNPTPAPLCNQPLPGVGAPYAPHGIFMLQPPGQSVVPSVLNNIQSQATVCGGDVYAVWSQIDAGNGQYNWTSVDSLIAPWAAIGKTVNLIVWGVSDSVPNNATPAYVLSDPTYQSVSCANAGTATSYAYPVYYSAGYKNNYKAFIQAVLARYGSNPGVGYIRFGIARGGEAFPTCLTQMMALGGYSSVTQFDSAWESYIAEMTAWQQSTLAQMATATGRTVQLMAALNQFGSPIQYNVTSFEAQNAVALGFGFGSQGLELSDIANFKAGNPCSSDWCANFVRFAGAAPLELQTIAASDPTNAAGGTGSMTTLLPFALQLRAQILEVYLQDLQVAYDAGSANYALYSQAYQQAFQNAALAVGGR